MSRPNVRLMFRYLQLNRRKKRRADDEANHEGDAFPPLEEFLKTVWDRHPTVGSRHVPPLQDGKAQEGIRYLVPLSRQVVRPGAALVRFCAYTAGESPGFAPHDLDAEEAAVEYAQVVDSDGRVLNPGVEFSVLLFGRVALLQNRSGVSAAESLKKAVHWFGRQIYGSAFVRPDFVHVAPRDLSREIDDAGGIGAVSFGVCEVVPQTGAATPLGDIHRFEDRLGAEKARVRLSAPKDSTLDTEASIELLEDPESEGIENVVLHLRNDQSIKGTEMVMSKLVSVPLKNGVPDSEAVGRELKTYLRELMVTSPQGDQAINPQGSIGDKLKVVAILND